MSRPGFGRLGPARAIAPTAPAVPVSTPWAIASLVCVNLFPLAGVAFFGWSTFDLMLLYWFENGVVGLYVALKMLLTAGPDASYRGLRGLLNKVFVIAVFAVHYSAFWSAHGYAVVALFGAGGPFGSNSDRIISLALDGPLVYFAGGFSIASVYVTGGLLLGASGLLVSHGVSFVGNVLQRREDLRAAPIELLMRPYPRVLVLHVALGVGAILVQRIGEPLAALALFVLLKTWLDLAAHLRAHRPRRSAQQVA